MPEGSIRSYFVDITGSSAGLIAAAGEGEAATAKLENRTAALSGGFANVGSAAKTHIGGTTVEQASLAEKGFGKIDSAIKNVVGSVVSMGTQMIGFGAVFGAGGLIYSGVKQAMDFNQALTLIQTQAGDTTDSLSKLSTEFLSLGPQVGQTPEALAQAYFHLASAGYTGQQALDMLTQSAKLADIGQSDLGQTTDAVVAIMKSGVPGINSASDAVSQLNAIVGSGNMHMQDLVSAMGSGVLPVAATFGVSLQSVGAAMAELTNQGEPAADAANKIRMAITLMGAPTKQAQKLLEDAGLSSAQAADQLSAMQLAFEKSGVSTTQLSQDLKQPDGIIAALSDLKQHMTDAGVTADEQDAIISRAFGGGKSGGTLVEFSHHLADVKTTFDQIGTSSGNFGKDWQQQSMTTSQRLADLKSAFDVVSIEVGTAFMPIIQSFGKWVGDHQQDIQNVAHTVGTDLANAAQTAGNFIGNTLWPALKNVGDFIGQHLQAFKDLGLAIGAFYVINKGVSILSPLLSDAQQLLGVAGKLPGLGGGDGGLAPVHVWVDNPGFGGGGGGPAAAAGEGEGGAAAAGVALPGVIGALSAGTLGAFADKQSPLMSDPAGQYGGISNILATLQGKVWKNGQMISGDLDYLQTQLAITGAHGGDIAVLAGEIADLYKNHEDRTAPEMQAILTEWNKGHTSAADIANLGADMASVAKITGPLTGVQMQEFLTLWESGVTNVTAISGMMQEVSDYSKVYGPPTSQDLLQMKALADMGVTDIGAVHTFLKDAPGAASGVTYNLQALANLLGGDISAAASLRAAISSDIGNIAPGGATGGTFGSYAAGGRTQGTWAMVGGHGPELVHLPSGSNVKPNYGGLGFGQMPASSGGGGGGGGGIYIGSLTLNLSGVQDPEQLWQAIQRVAVTQGAQQGVTTALGQYR